jgi:hypothetical protein
MGGIGSIHPSPGNPSPVRRWETSGPTLSATPAPFSVHFHSWMIPAGIIHEVMREEGITEMNTN